VADPGWIAHRIARPKRLARPAEYSSRAVVDGPEANGKVVGDGRSAVAKVDYVPAGKYGKAALDKLGVWPDIVNKVPQAENVRAALLLVSRRRGVRRHRLSDRCRG
jgi:ABC-type molybdate transport system substrate-binding protein